MPVGQFLISASTQSHNGFVDAALCCSSIGKQLHKHLVSAGLFNGESNHGCRKGRMQEYAADGMDHAAIGKVAQPRFSPRLSVVLIWVGMRFARAMQGGTVSRL